MDASTLALLRLDEGAGAPFLSRGDVGRLTLSFDSLPLFLDEECGSCAATHDFLERGCGVRWYAPTELGMVYAKQATLAPRVEERRRAPAFPTRIISRVGTVPPGKYPLYAVLNNYTWLDACLWELRLRMGGKNNSANHGLYSYYDRFWEEKPAEPRGFRGRAPRVLRQGVPREAAATVPDQPRVDRPGGQGRPRVFPDGNEQTYVGRQ